MPIDFTQQQLSHWNKETIMCFSYSCDFMTVYLKAYTQIEDK